MKPHLLQWILRRVSFQFSIRYFLKRPVHYKQSVSQMIKQLWTRPKFLVFTNLTSCIQKHFMLAWGRGKKKIYIYEGFKCFIQLLIFQYILQNCMQRFQALTLHALIIIIIYLHTHFQLTGCYKHAGHPDNIFHRIQAQSEIT